MERAELGCGHLAGAMPRPDRATATPEEWRTFQATRLQAWWRMVVLRRAYVEARAQWLEMRGEGSGAPPPCTRARGGRRSSLGRLRLGEVSAELCETAPLGGVIDHEKSCPLVAHADSLDQLLVLRPLREAALALALALACTVGADSLDCRFPKP